MFYVYILYSSSLDKYYVGSTQEIDTRIEKHLTNHKGFTSKAKDWVLKHSESYNTRSEAVQRETQIKKWKSRVIIEKIINQS